MSLSSDGSTSSCLEPVQHHMVPQRSAVAEATGVLANGAACANLRCGVSL